MTDTAQLCPSNWTLITSPKRSCGRSTGTSDYTDDCCCDSATFSAQGVRYSQVCGRIIAYQVGHPEAFAAENLGHPMTIDGPYVDGVSVTRGNPRQHIWTFACALSEISNSAGICPCTNPGSTTRIPSYISEDYFCETGVPPGQSYGNIFYSDDPLWDGDGCGPTSSCCTFNDPPWFCRQLPQTTTDDIEVRICSIQQLAAENVPIESIAIYVK